MHNSTIPTHVVIFFLHYIFLLFYNCCVFIYSTVAGRKCEINIIVKSKVHRQTITRQISVYTPYVLQRPSKWLRRTATDGQTDGHFAAAGKTRQTDTYSSGKCVLRVRHYRLRIKTTWRWTSVLSITIQAEETEMSRDVADWDTVGNQPDYIDQSREIALMRMLCQSQRQTRNWCRDDVDQVT